MNNIEQAISSLTSQVNFLTGKRIENKKENYSMIVVGVVVFLILIYLIVNRFRKKRKRKQY